MITQEIRNPTNLSERTHTMLTEDPVMYKHKTTAPQRRRK